jgi:peptidoglycan/xylan/chitin deacetylase (PgdA/CDA1 family)
MKPITEALAERTAPLSFFFRNDDAGWAQDALDLLLDLFASRAIPIDLAVIPAVLDDVVAKRLGEWRTDYPVIGLHQHGYAHLDHEAVGVRKCEFGPSRSDERQMGDIVAGRIRLEALLGDVDPIFTPPWNRCALRTANALSDFGFSLISDDGALSKAGCEFPCLPISFDWERHRRSGELIPKLATHIQRAEQPIGIMLHHETMDGEAREGLGEFLDVLSVSPAVLMFPMRHWIGSDR